MLQKHNIESWVHKLYSNNSKVISWFYLWPTWICYSFCCVFLFVAYFLLLLLLCMFQFYHPILIYLYYKVSIRNKSIAFTSFFVFFGSMFLFNFICNLVAEMNTHTLTKNREKQKQQTGWKMFGFCSARDIRIRWWYSFCLYVY